MAKKECHQKELNLHGQSLREFAIELKLSEESWRGEAAWTTCPELAAPKGINRHDAESFRVRKSFRDPKATSPQLAAMLRNQLGAKVGTSTVTRKSNDHGHMKARLEFAKTHLRWGRQSEGKWCSRMNPSPNYSHLIAGGST